MANGRDKSTQAPSKIEMSAEWTPEERAELVAVLDIQITGLDTEERGLRKTIHYEAPCFAEIGSKRTGLAVLRTYAKEMPSQFLETNRSSYAAYVTQ